MYSRVKPSFLSNSSSIGSVQFMCLRGPFKGPVSGSSKTKDLLHLFLKGLTYFGILRTLSHSRPHRCDWCTIGFRSRSLSPHDPHTADFAYAAPVPLSPNPLNENLCLIRTAYVCSRTASAMRSLNSSPSHLIRSASAREELDRC